MSYPRTMIFVDGENVVFRYQAMIAAGKKRAAKVSHIKDAMVWHPSLTECGSFDLARVSYYTSTVGDDAHVARLNADISAVTYTYDHDPQPDMPLATGQLVPRVFKKHAKSHKSRLVDIHITIDAMRTAFLHNVDLLILYSGDGDYLELIREVMRHGKMVYVGAFSSGLDPALRYTADEFIDLDTYFFTSPSAKKT